MRRLFTALLAVLLLVQPVRGAKVSRAALVFEGGEAADVALLLQELQKRGCTATFCIPGQVLRRDPGSAEQILKAGHELGLRGFSGDLSPLSRRRIAEELAENRRLLPKKSHPRWLLLPGKWTAAPRQVAKAANVAVLDGLLNGMTPGIVDQIRCGSIISMGPVNRQSIAAAAALADTLSRRGIRLVSVTELASAQGIRILPGYRYSRLSGAASALDGQMRTHWKFA